MPKPLVAVALVSALAALPLLAQRGGFGAHSSGGFAAHAAPAIHAFDPHSGFATATHFNSFNGGARIAERPLALPSFNRRYGGLRDDRYRRAYSRTYPVAVPYAVNGWIPPGYFDSGIYDDSVAGPPVAGYVGDPANAASPPAPQQDQSAARPEGQPAPVFRAPYVRSQPQPDPVPDTAVTLIFKDGRPSEQIHNYMLTRTTLYVQEQHLRRIPVNQLDLEATSKANLDSGIDFRLPDAVR